MRVAGGPLWSMIAATALAAACSSNSNGPTPTLAGEWTVNVGSADLGAVTPASFHVDVWTSGDSFVVNMPVLAWSGGPIQYNGQPRMIHFALTDTLAGFEVDVPGFPCHSMEIWGSPSATKDSLRNAVVKMYDTDSANLCVSHHGASATVVKTGATSGSAPSPSHLTAAGTWHVAITAVANTGAPAASGGAIVPDSFTVVLGTGAGGVTASVPPLTFDDFDLAGGTWTFDTLSAGYVFGGDTVTFAEALHGVGDQSCRGIGFYGLMNERPNQMAGTFFVQDSTNLGGGLCSIIGYGSFNATKGP